MNNKKLLIGRKDIIDFPELNLYDVKVKVDTGAYSSAIHCSKIKLNEEKGEKYLSFRVPGSSTKKTFKVKEFTRKKIKSSSGHMEERFVIKTKVRIFNKLYTTEFSLTDRSRMKFPVLLGRRLLRKKFVVDVSLSDLSYKKKNLMLNENSRIVEE